MKKFLLVIALLTVSLVTATVGITVFDLTFDQASDATDWTVDRYDTEIWENATYDGEGRLHINIDESGDTTGFYAYQGRKYLDDGEHWSTEMTTVFEYSFYVDPAWEEDGIGQQTGMWAVLGNDEAITAYDILEYQDSDAAGDEARFRHYGYSLDENDEIVASWETVKVPGNVQKGGWIDVRAVLVKSDEGPDAQSELWWYVNNAKVLESEGINLYGESTRFLEPILNSRNFGVDQDYYYDDISLGESETKGRGPLAPMSPE